MERFKESVDVLGRTRNRRFPSLQRIQFLIRSNERKWKLIQDKFPPSFTRGNIFNDYFVPSRVSPSSEIKNFNA